MKIPKPDNYELHKTCPSCGYEMNFRVVDNLPYYKCHECGFELEGDISV